MCYHKGSADRSEGLEICKAIVESWQAEVDAGRCVASDRALDAVWWAIEELERLRTIVAPIETLTANGAASVLLYEVAGVEASEKFTVAVNECLPPRFEYFDGATYAEALAKAIEARRNRGSE